jgi:adenylate cyclase
VNISQDTYDLIKDYFLCESRGLISAKNKGNIPMYLVKGFLPEYADPINALRPNQQFKRMYAAELLF